ncbi:helix-hairpin-helix domain-containing protein [Terrabacter sp. MAHUQ-38]|uniref:helix-hairpin-helix domain-containing protein n=1 Tax=unclassified Terrabacter TaxID=2630222 RepID=UPI00165D4A49|nr:helix-hairpin-helix domain-containing protein [Terrabacter sp. MAHUQ-38]MBC9823029.1 helix-hairpin-helix domain-containing protein [Terrabacter sp. MAHUQ-38]
MPFRPAPRAPDLERVARVLGDEQDAGWVPTPPAAGLVTEPGPGPVVAAVRRLAPRAADDDEVARLDADLRRARRPSLLTVPDELRTGRRGISSAALVSLLALVVAVGCAFVLRVLWAERSAVPDLAPGPSRSVQVEGEKASAAKVPSMGATGARGSPSVAGASTVGTEVVVHVVGQVARAGLVRLPQGARVADAITAAGGVKPGSDLSALNLARLLVDGEQVRVPKRGEAPVVGGGAGAGGGSGGAGGMGGSRSTTGGGSAAGGMVSLNTADATALDTLPGVGPVLAQRIIDWRAEHGRFTSVDELGEVSGIGDKLMAQLRPKVTL